MYHGCAGLREEEFIREKKGQKKSQRRKERFSAIHFALIQYSVLRALALLWLFS
jgi:hypothetical protein